MKWCSRRINDRLLWIFLEIPGTHFFNLILMEYRIYTQITKLKNKSSLTRNIFIFNYTYERTYICI